jgi:hypothetical protein
MLRTLKDDEVVRPASANRNTVEALAEPGLIIPAKSRNPLKIVWRTRSVGSKATITVSITSSPCIRPYMLLSFPR